MSDQEQKDQPEFIERDGNRFKRVAYCARYSNKDGTTKEKIYYKYVPVSRNRRGRKPGVRLESNFKNRLRAKVKELTNEQCKQILIDYNLLD